MWLIILQVVIIIMGTSAKILVGSRKYNMRRLGYIVGISTEALWAILFWQTKLPLMLLLCVLYSFGWWTGLHRHPREKRYYFDKFGPRAKRFLIQEDSNELRQKE